VKVSGISWHDGGFFYSRYPEPQSGTSALASKNEFHSVWYHVPGTSQYADKLVYSDKNNPDMFHFCWVVEGTNMLMRSSRIGGSVGTSLYVRSWSDSAQPWTVFFHRDSVSFGIIDVIDDTLYAVTNDRAPRNRVVRIVNFRTKWTEETIVPESADVLESATYKAGRLILTYMRDVFNHVVFTNNRGNVLDSLALPTKGDVGGFSSRKTDTTLLYSFSSYAYPPVTFEFNPKTHASTLWNTTQVPFRVEDIVARQVFVTSKDGTRIPMTILQMPDKAAIGTSPTILYGYGGFNITQGPAFNPLLIAWLERGGTYCIANIRGGGEYGEEWHRAGTTTRKQNVFDDFIACAEWLITNRICSKGSLAINGRSNGGLLVGAVMTQRPDLFAAAIPEVGVLDMLRYHLFTIGWNWRGDYGSVDNEAEYRALRAYSPYHNLRSNVEYPATLVMTADHDDRVVPAHSFKFYARLRELYKGRRPMLMRVETRSGHGAVNLGVMLDGVADKWAFAWNVCMGRFAAR
jgi:prolyl oligopeptidase